MKILQINVNLNVGSTGKIAHEIGLQIINEQWSSTIAYGRSMKQSSSMAIKVGSKIDQSFHLLGTRVLDSHGLHSRNATKSLLERINKEKYDLIHLHNLHGYYLNYEILFDGLKKLDSPVVWTLHDCWAFTGHCAHFVHIGCEKWKTECFQCPLKKTYPASLGLDGSKRNYTKKKGSFLGHHNLHIVAVSNWLKNLISESFLKSYNHTTIYNGINTEVFKPSSNDEVKEIKKKYEIKKDYVLGVSNIWTDRKGLSDFIQLRSVLDINIDIVLVGLSGSQIESLPEGIISIARTDNQEELAYLYSGAKVFLNFSILETFGLVTAEALSCGTPAIVYDATASPELIEEGIGHVVSVGDIDIVAQRIDEISKKDQSELSRMCRASALRRFNMNIQNKKYINLYKELIQ